MQRSVRVCAVVLAMAIGSPAAAQVKRRDHRKPREATGIAVSKWWPQSGPVGTAVTIEGEGFSRRTKLLFGGRVLKPRRITATRINFNVPKSYGDGTIFLRDSAGYDDEDYDVGTYVVVVPDPPVITRWEPQWGPVGTTVRIEGRHFDDDVRVLWGKSPIKISRSGSGWIEVEVPRRARRDEHFSVRNGYGISTTPKKFELYATATISKLDKLRATYGETVIVHGANFPSNAEVFWGDDRLEVRRVDRRGNRLWIDIPEDLDTDTRWLFVYDGRNRVRSPQQFEVYQDQADDEYDDDVKRRDHRRRKGKRKRNY